MKRIAGLVLIAAVLGAGCSTSPESKLVGRWRGEVQMAEDQAKAPGADLMKGLTAMFSSDLELREDKTFTMQMSIVNVDGTWSVQGNKVLCDPKKVMGQDITEARARGGNLSKAASGPDVSQPMEFEVSPDGTTLALKGTEEAEKMGRYIFKKL